MCVPKFVSFEPPSQAFCSFVPRLSPRMTFVIVIQGESLGMRLGILLVWKTWYVTMSLAVRDSWVRL